MKSLLAVGLFFIMDGAALPHAAAQDGETMVAPTPPTAPRAPRARAFGTRRAPSGYLGVGAADIDEERARFLKLKDDHGVEVKSVESDSPAAKAGLKEGNVILEYNGQRVEGMEQFIRMVRETPVNRKVTLLVSREGATQTLTATIGSHTDQVFGNNFEFEMPEMPTMPPGSVKIPDFPSIQIPGAPGVLLSWQDETVGIEAESLSPQLAEYFGVKAGVLVRSIAKNSRAEKAGMKAGDVVVKVNGVGVSNPRDIAAQMRSGRGRRAASFVMMRNRREITLELKPIDGRQHEDAPDEM